MAIDGLFCARLAEELSSAVGAKIEKINQTGDEEITLRLYGESGRKSLLISASRQNARACFCPEEAQPQSPVPTPFCMLLRKHLQNGRITAVFAPKAQRIVCIDAEVRDELGYPCRRRIYAELMGKYSNILLTDAEGDKVLGALYQTDITFSARTVLVGLPYEAPPKQDKEDPFSVTRQRFSELCISNSGRDCADFFLKTFLMFSPLIAREAAHRAAADGRTVAEAEEERLWHGFNEVLHCGTFPCRVLDAEGKEQAFSYLPLTQYGAGFTIEAEESLSALLCVYFEEKGRQEKHDRHSSDLLRLVSNLRQRAEKKRGLQLQSLEESRTKDDYKRKGDLIIGSIYLLKQGMESAELMNYETGKTETVQLDKRLSPSANANRYYRKYTKLKNAEAAMKVQLERTERELLYIDSVSDAIRRAETDGEFDDIRAELEQSGFLRRGKAAKRKKQLSKPLEYKVDGGYTVKVGRNNLQNEALTFSAAKGDIWFHVKNAPGSHTVLLAGGDEPSALAYTQAAMIAAFHSSLRGSPSAAVDYTRVRFVKKPPGTAYGFVNYTNYHTAYVGAELPAF